MSFIKSCSGFAAQLFRPFAYLLIEHPSKWQMDWLLPGILSAISILITIFLLPDINIYGDSGVISRVLGFVQNLPGFYIAALAAIATFGRTDIDNVLPAPTPTITEQREGVQDRIPLTRRRFLCMMFAFLTAESVVLVLFSILVLSVAGHIQIEHAASAKVLSHLFFFGYLFALYQMILATFWGLFYLGDRIHRVE